MIDDALNQIIAHLEVAETALLGAQAKFDAQAARITELEAQLTEARNTERAAVAAYLDEGGLYDLAYYITRGDHVSPDPS
jgi:hypothetical protein